MLTRFYSKACVYNKYGPSIVSTLFYLALDLNPKTVLFVNGAFRGWLSALPKKFMTRLHTLGNKCVQASRNDKLINPSRIYSDLSGNKCLESHELLKLENAFRSWSEETPRVDVRISRKRVLLIFLLIRYTGARLNEALGVDLARDIDSNARKVVFGASTASTKRCVQISASLTREIKHILQEIVPAGEKSLLLKIDEGHIRRKFYERTVSCGFPQEFGAPQAIRRARAVELMKNNVPLPVVQRILGHSNPNLTASLVSFSEEDIHQVTQHFIEKESARKTSARNTFFGKITRIVNGDVQSLIELLTLTGEKVSSVITNNSLSRLGIKSGSLVTAEVKAPWVLIHKSLQQPLCASENIFMGKISKILKGMLVIEITVKINDGTEICSLMTVECYNRLQLKESDKVWASFNSFSVILHVD